MPALSPGPRRLLSRLITAVFFLAAPVSAQTLTGTLTLNGNVVPGAIVTISGAGGFATISGTPASGQLAQWAGAAAIAGITLGGDCTISGSSITCLKTNGTAFGPFATASAGSGLAVAGGTASATFTQAGSGAVTIPANTKMGFNLDIRDYGANCNGSANTAPAIQAAVVETNNLGGGVIEFPQGTCVIGSAIVETDGGVTFRGRGREATIIAPSGNFNAFSIGGTSVIAGADRVLDLEVSRSGTVAGGCAIQATLADDLHIKNVFINNPYNGICIGGGAAMILEDITIVGFVSNGGNLGIWAYNQAVNTTSAPSLPTQWYWNRINIYGPGVAAGGAFANLAFISATESLDITNCNFGQAGSWDMVFYQDNTTGGSPDTLVGNISNVGISTTYFDIGVSGGIAFNTAGATDGATAIWDVAIVASKFVGEGGVELVGATQKGIYYDGAYRSGKPFPYALSNLRVSATDIYGYGGNGIDIEGGQNIAFDAIHVNGNNCAYTGSGGTYCNVAANAGAAGAGVKIGAGVAGFTWTGGSSGHHFLGRGTQWQTYGLYVANGAQNVAVDAVDMTGNTVGGVGNNVTAATTSPSTITLTNIMGFNGGRSYGIPTITSGATQYNPYFSPALVYIAYNATNTVYVNGTAIALGYGGAFQLGAQDSIRVDWSAGSESWLWMPQ